MVNGRRSRAKKAKVKNEKEKRDIALEAKRNERPSQWRVVDDKFNFQDIFNLGAVSFGVVIMDLLDAIMNSEQFGLWLGGEIDLTVKFEEIDKLSDWFELVCGLNRPCVLRLLYFVGRGAMANPTRQRVCYFLEAAMPLFLRNLCASGASESIFEAWFSWLGELQPELLPSGDEMKTSWSLVRFRLNTYRLAQKEAKLPELKLMFPEAYIMGETLSMYSALVSTRCRDEVGYFLRRVQMRLPSIKVDGLKEALKKASAMFKMAGPKLTDAWTYFVDMHILNGFIATGSHDIEDAKDWFLRDNEPKVAQSFYDKLPKYLDKWFSFGNAARAKVAFSKSSDEKQWFLGASWATGGSISSGDLLPGIEGVRRTKASLGAVGDLRTLFSRVMTRQHAVYKVITKKEQSKLRAVVKGPDERFILERWVLDILEPSMKNHPHTTLFSDTTDYVNKFCKVSDTCAAGWWQAPIDMDKFDHCVTPRMLRECWAALRRWLVAAVGQDLADHPFVKMLDWYAEDGIYVDMDGNVVKATSGLPSGMGFTALYDTLISYSLAQYGLDATAAPEAAGLLFTQGDDICLAHRSQQAIELVIQKVNEAGFTANKNKFWIDRERNEFLRTVITGFTAAGYPARAFSSVCYANPLSGVLNPGKDRLEQQVSTWKTFALRGVDVPVQLVGYDCAKGNLLPVDVVIAALRTSRAIGGLGWENGRQGVAITPIEKEPKARKAVADFLEPTLREFKLQEVPRSVEAMLLDERVELERWTWRKVELQSDEPLARYFGPDGAKIGEMINLKVKPKSLILKSDMWRPGIRRLQRVLVVESIKAGVVDNSVLARYLTEPAMLAIGEQKHLRKSWLLALLGEDDGIFVLPGLSVDFFGRMLGYMSERLLYGVPSQALLTGALVFPEDRVQRLHKGGAGSGVMFSFISWAVSEYINRTVFFSKITDTARYGDFQF